MLQFDNADFGVDTSFYGRVRNLSLPANTQNSLVPLFEAVMNGIHGIEDKFGSDRLSDGEIKIFITREPKESSIIGFTVADNGIGLDDANLKSFFKSDSPHKWKRGGKGVGRLSWLKAFKNTKIRSVHGENTSKISTIFDFTLDEKNQIQNFSQSIDENPYAITGVIVEMNPFRSTFQNVCPKKPDAIAKKIIKHFLSYFLTTNVPEITVFDGDDIVFDLNDMAADLQKEEQEYDIVIPHSNGEIKRFLLNCFKIKKSFSDDESGNHTIYYMADSRAVKRVVIDNTLGLKVLKDNLVFCATVSGEYCDATANQERTAFNWSDDFFKELNKIVLDKTKIYLASEIAVVREIQIETIEKIGKENPRFYGFAKDPKSVVEDLALGVQSEEDIYLELTRKTLRKFKKQRSAFSKARKTNQDIKTEAKRYISLLEDEALSSLAECVYKRKLILDLMDTKMEYLEGADKKRALEEAVHEIICPLGVNSDEIPYNDHNLWIVDDSLAFYTFFGSDQSFSKLSKKEIKSAKEPDLIFFDQTLGFDRKNSDQPITIIEFKRPERDDYRPDSNPIRQVRNYVDLMRKKGAAMSDMGRQIKAVDDSTHFVCHIIADITPTLRQQMKELGPFNKKAGRNSYYKWDEPYKIFIEISSYEEVIKNARARHEEFFTQLGVS